MAAESPESCGISVYWPKSKQNNHTLAKLQIMLKDMLCNDLVEFMREI